MILAKVDPDPSVPVLFCSKDVDFQIQRTYFYGVRYLNDFFHSICKFLACQQLGVQ